MNNITLSRRLAAELIGTAFLLAAVVGSGIMGERLAGGNVAITLLANTIPTGAILVVLITMLGPISGAHFNPAVTAVFAAKREMSLSDSALYVLVQIIGGLIGVWVAHLMFEEVFFQTSAKMRTGQAQWFAEWVATFGLIFTISLPFWSHCASKRVLLPWPLAFTSRRPTGSRHRPPLPIRR